MGKECKDHLGNVYSSIRDMCKFWNISKATYKYRKKHGWSLEDILTKSVTSIAVKKECTDHLGNKYSSLTEMCKVYKIKTNTFHDRIERGLSMKDALTMPVIPSVFKIQDHLGNTYNSIKEMCTYYHISPKTYNNRIHAGWSIEEALVKSRTYKTKQKECADHLGNIYPSIKDMCKFWNISKEKYKYRKRNGWSLEDILTKSVTSAVVKKECTDHLGNVYSSIKDMCAFYKISQDTFNFRLKAGWTLEEALTIPIYKYNSSYNKCYDHLGNEYKSTQEMCKKYNIDRNTYRNRIKRGWSIEEALTKPTSSLSASKIQDHLGNEYNSLTEMCKAYKIRINTFRSRIERGSSIKDALTMPVASSTSKIQDHLGNEYRSIKEMCKKYHIADSTYRDRINNGWSVEEALTINIIKKPKKEYITCCNNDHKSLNKSISKENHLIQDHLGNTYKSIKEMCRKYNIDYNVYDLRIKNGWDLEKALTTSTRKQIHRKHSQPVYDYLGKSYANEKAMCKYYNIPWKTFRMRCHYKKWPLEKALSEPVSSKNSHYNIQDHLGNSFNSVREMLNYYHNNITNVTYRNRLMRGWTKEEAITIPRDMYIGEYRVAECLKQLNVKFYHDCQIKVIFRDFNLSVNWDEFLNKLKEHLNSAGINWSKKKIEKLRPDFVLYTDENNKIRGVIEFDGEQHQNFFEFFTKTIEEFLYRSDSDFVKQTLWEYLNIPMLRIRHDQVDMIDEMVTDFVNQPEKYINNHNTYLSEEEYWSILTEQKAKIESAFAA